MALLKKLTLWADDDESDGFVLRDRHGEELAFLCREGIRNLFEIPVDVERLEIQIHDRPAKNRARLEQRQWRCGAFADSYWVSAEITPPRIVSADDILDRFGKTVLYVEVLY